MYHKYDFAGWYTGATDQQIERSTPLAPANLIVTEVVGEMRANWTGYEWINLPYAAPVDTPIEIVVPAFVTRRQALQQLIIDGLDDEVEAVLAAIPDLTQRKLMRVWYQDSQVFERNRPEINAVWQALGKTQQELDQTFINAAKL